MKIYMDVCCWNRPFDDQSQERVRVEGNTIRTILWQCKAGKLIIAGSPIIDMELEKCQDFEKLQSIRAFYSVTQLYLPVTAEVKTRSLMFQRYGIKTLDSLHIALAEVYRLDVFLTTDDKLLKTASKIKTAVKVANPVSWLMEAAHNGN